MKKVKESSNEEGSPDKKPPVSRRQKDQIAAAHKGVIDALEALGAADMQAAGAEVKRDQARKKVVEAGKAREDIVRAAAQALDLDLDSETWTYDFASGCFTKKTS